MDKDTKSFETPPILLRNRTKQGDELMAIKRNLHTIDMIVRLIIGVALVYVGFIDTSYIANSTVRILLGVFGAVNIVAALVRSCPIYALAGISTYREKAEN